jgi:hypothetical protein
MLLVKHCDNPFTRLKLGNMLANSQDDSGTIRAGNDIRLDTPGVFSLGDNDVAKLSPLLVEVDKIDRQRSVH